MFGACKAVISKEFVSREKQLRFCVFYDRYKSEHHSRLRILSFESGKFHLNCADVCCDSCLCVHAWMMDDIVLQAALLRVRINCDLLVDSINYDILRFDAKHLFL